MSRKEIEAKVKKVIIELLEIEPERVQLESAIINGLGECTDLCADSLDVIELWMAFEEVFDLEVTDEEAMKICTVKDIVDYVESHT